MDANTLKEAMRFGADVSQEMERLGKFGLGLKLASLSQARELRVVSAQGGRFFGRAWQEHGIADGFVSTIFETAESRDVITKVMPDHGFVPSATVVWWSHLYRVGHDHSNPQEHAQKLMRRLDNYLSLAFHRFLSGRPRAVRLTLDMFDQRSGRPGIPINLDPLDPFDYDQSGQRDFPAAMVLDDGYRDRIAIKAHIWPANSGAAEYKLPGGANSRQGFYFYRNHRLIQGGGWNGIRETEPHSSLARLEVDIASDFDLDVNLGVKKDEIQLPPALVASIMKSKTASGVDFKKYLSIADETYRTRKMTEAELPLIPSLGLPSELIKFLHVELRVKATAKYRDLMIKWMDLGEERFFDIDRDGGCLFLNLAFRKPLLHGLPGSSADIPTMKCLLFLALEDVLSSERFGSKIRERIDRMNRILVEAVKYERRPE
jgi:hypothetical protein